MLIYTKCLETITGIDYDRVPCIKSFTKQNLLQSSMALRLSTFQRLSRIKVTQIGG